MNLYKVEIKKNSSKENARHWGDEYYFVIASSFGNAEDKAKKFQSTYGTMENIQYMGEVTHDKDVILLRDRL